MDYVSISSAIASGKALAQILKTIASVKLDTETVVRVNEAQHRVSDLLTALLDTQGDLFKLQNENQELRGQLKTQEDWETTKAKYRLVSTGGGATVYEFIEGSAKYYACPVCFSKKTVSPLQTTDGGYYNCPSCKGSEYKVKDPAPRPPIKVETDFDPRF
jgi:hypothetical protein